MMKKKDLKIVMNVKGTVRYLMIVENVEEKPDIGESLILQLYGEERL